MLTSNCVVCLRLFARRPAAGRRFGGVGPALRKLRLLAWQTPPMATRQLLVLGSWRECEIRRPMSRWILQPAARGSCAVEGRLAREFCRLRLFPLCGGL